MSNTDGEDTQPLREHFEMDTDAGTTIRTFDYIDALEKYNEQLSKQLKQKEDENRELVRGLQYLTDRMIPDIEDSKEVWAWNNAKELIAKNLSA